MPPPWRPRTRGAVTPYARSTRPRWPSSSALPTPLPRRASCRARWRCRPRRSGARHKPRRASAGRASACPAGRSQRPVGPDPHSIVRPQADLARRLSFPTFTLHAIAGASGKPAAMANPRTEPATDS
ncbi:hypothetical protein CBM2586_B30128 [Cupriavidus phytorum]|uniref:Uncharacterized protein n=1 Tax=Cupriavidus taiwanensis TaxID=164546 RepID=A0A975XJR1_9BURK|nr:hypothetical protein CBM2586_B30128 [Cupriavidus taiwanensis]